MDDLKLAVVLDFPCSDSLGGGKKSAVPSRGGGSRSQGDLSQYKQEFVSTQVTEYERALKAINLTGATRSARQAVLLKVIESCINPIVANLATSTEQLPTKLNVNGLFEKSLQDGIDPNHLPAGVERVGKQGQKRSLNNSFEDDEENTNYINIPAPTTKQQRTSKEELEDTKKLKDDGVLDEEEFKACKKVVLERFAH